MKLKGKESQRVNRGMKMRGNEDGGEKHRRKAC